VSSGTHSAVDAAVSVARAHGLPCEDAVVLRDAWFVLVHLRPSPVVARVSSDALGAGSGDVARELSVARHAASRGAPVIPPSDLLDPGPHRHDGRTIAFWKLVDDLGRVDAVAAGRGLRSIHDALVDFDGDLPALHEMRPLLDELPASDDTELLHELASAPLPVTQALHGDAHLSNCMQTTAGTLWHDFETSCRGPREYDLAALVHHERIHGGDGRAAHALEA
jgi:Ser/Thr protein kinase RdoA (MazF antagonist)